MDGEVQPRCGLIVSLVLMNLTAIVLFFYASPPREIPKKPIDQVMVNPQPIQVPMAGDTPVVYEDERIVVAIAPDQPDNVVVSEKRHKLKKTGVEPHLAIALRKFVSDTGSGVRVFFEGLKNGYTKKRIRENVQKKKSGTEEVSINSAASSKPSTHKNKKSQEPTPEIEQYEDECASQEMTSTDMVLDVLSRTQTRTNELINIFSKQVVPAIERMNDKVADAVRLEKNLDSYTATLINAINSTVCPNEDNVDCNKPRTGVVKKLKDRKPHVNLTPGGESSNKRPVFKILSARCWHTRNRKRMNNRVRSNISKVELQPKEDQFKHPDTNKNSANEAATEAQEVGNAEDIEEPLGQRTIGIEEVLALTSTLEQDESQDMKSVEDLPQVASPFEGQDMKSVEDLPQVGSPFEGQDKKSVEDLPQVGSPFDVSNVSMSAEGIVTKSTVIQPREINIKHAEYVVTKEFPECVLPSLENDEHLQRPDFSVVFDSHIQDYDSSTVHSSSVISHSADTTSLDDSLEYVDSKVAQKPDTMEIVNSFQQKSMRMKEEALENVCLLVLKIFEAWSGYPRTGISRLTLQSYSSKEEHSWDSRPCTAICIPDPIVDNQPKPSPIKEGPNTTSQVPLNVLEAAGIQIVEQQPLARPNVRNPLFKGGLKNYTDSGITATSGFGDIKEPLEEPVSAELPSKSHDSIKVSKESSSATFYTGMLDSSEDAFYECASTLSAATCASVELEVEDSSKLFLERIQEEGVHKSSVQSSHSIESWLTESETCTEHDSPDGPDDEMLCSPMELSTQENDATRDRKSPSKKKKWGATFFKKILKKKPKSSAPRTSAQSKNRIRPGVQNESTE